MKALRVLIVEDDAVIAHLFAELLASIGCDVCSIEFTESGAVATARSLEPDLMIVDACLGQGCGITAVDTILEGGYIPHVFVSGDAYRIRAWKPRAIVLQKPFHEAQIAWAMKRALAVKSSNAPFLPAGPAVNRAT